MRIRFIYILLLPLILFALDIFLGSVYIPPSEILKSIFGSAGENFTYDTILFSFRLPKAITALCAGAALAVSGLIMQTLFRNPLAGPYVLGVSSGASLGVALVIMAADITGSAIIAGMGGSFGTAIAASIGASAILLLILLIAEKVHENVTLLIIGIMIGHITSAVVGILQYFSSASSLQGYILWSLGSFSNVSWSSISILITFTIAGLVISFLLSKQLNALILGEAYAKSLGVNIRLCRFLIILCTAMLAGAVTAFCGPIAFLGMAIPHMARPLIKSTDHRKLIPGCICMGAAIALFCDIAAQLPGQGETLPVNAVTSIVGAPVVIWVIMKRRKTA
jgi:iron complex transport system permease protein